MPLRRSREGAVQQISGSDVRGATVLNEPREDASCCMHVAALIDDRLWNVLEPLIPPAKQRRFRYPGRKRLPDRAALNGILYVLKTGIPWRALPPELGFGSGVSCWRRLRDWRVAGIWDVLHARISGWSAIPPIPELRCFSGASVRARAEAPGIPAKTDDKSTA